MANRTQRVVVAVYPDTRMEWRTLSKLLQEAAFRRGEPPGACSRWIDQAIRRQIKATRAELARMGIDPDRILAERFGQSPPPDETDSGYGNVSDVSNDPD
jgi:hypothetical protein